MPKVLDGAKKRRSRPRGASLNRQIQRVVGQPTKARNPLDHYRPIDFCRWSEAPAVSDAVDELVFEVRGTKAGRGTHRRQLAAHLRIST